MSREHAGDETYDTQTVNIGVAGGVAESITSDLNEWKSITNFVLSLMSLSDYDDCNKRVNDLTKIDYVKQDKKLGE